MKTEIKNEWIYEQSPNEVWEYLTQAELLALWLMPNDIKPVLGHEFKFRIKPVPSLDLDGIFHCRILDIIPFKKLTYTWKGGPGGGNFTLDTVVEWTLAPHGSGTKLMLVQSGFKQHNLAIFNSMTDGWHNNILKMMKYLDSNKN